MTIRNKLIESGKKCPFCDDVIGNAIVEPCTFCNGAGTVLPLDSCLKIIDYETHNTRIKTIDEVKDCLLHHTFLMSHENGYPSMVVTKATILSLKGLMGLPLDK